MRDDIHKHSEESLEDCKCTLNVSYKINFIHTLYIIVGLKQCRKIILGAFPHTHTPPAPPQDSLSFFSKKSSSYPSPVHR